MTALSICTQSSTTCDDWQPILPNDTGQDVAKQAHCQCEGQSDDTVFVSVVRVVICTLRWSVFVVVCLTLYVHGLGLVHDQIDRLSGK